MVFNDVVLRALAETGHIDPYNPDCINPASINLHLGERIRVPDSIWETATEDQMWEWIGTGEIHTLPRWSDEFQFSNYWLFPRRFVLCHSLEIVDIPDDAMALLLSRSTTGRHGVEHLHSGLGDNGFKGQWTWELHNVAPWPFELIPGQRLMQMMLIRTTGAAEKPYNGRYQNQVGAVPAR